jgi:hypothetical protein
MAPSGMAGEESSLSLFEVNVAVPVFWLFLPRGFPSLVLFRLSVSSPALFTLAAP